MRYNATVLQGNEQGCPPDELRERARTNISEDIRVLLRGTAGSGRLQSEWLQWFWMDQDCLSKHERLHSAMSY